MEKRDSSISIGKCLPDLGRPSRSFKYPHHVVSDQSLGLDEKRAILAAWASDAHAVESFPTLRHLPGTPFPVTLSSIMDARLRLDDATDIGPDLPIPSPGRAEHHVPRSMPKRSIQNTLLFALDRTGRLQTARWNDVHLMADNRDGTKGLSKSIQIKTSQNQFTKPAGTNLFGSAAPREESFTQLAPKQT